MSKKPSPAASSIAAGLKEAIIHAHGEQVPGIRVVDLPDANPDDCDKERN